MARLWWSNGEPDRLLRVADNTGAFDTVLSLVGESGAGSAQADKIASLIERFLTDLGSSHRELLIAQLARVFASYQRSELAEELKRAD
jgi:hypothetical protein